MNDEIENKVREHFGLHAEAGTANPDEKAESKKEK